MGSQFGSTMRPPNDSFMRRWQPLKLTVAIDLLGMVLTACGGSPTLPSEATTPSTTAVLPLLYRVTAACATPISTTP
jgi:hypothetical protein